MPRWSAAARTSGIATDNRRGGSAIDTSGSARSQNSVALIHSASRADHHSSPAAASPGDRCGEGLRRRAPPRRHPRRPQAAGAELGRIVEVHETETRPGPKGDERFRAPAGAQEVGVGQDMAAQILQALGDGRQRLARGLPRSATRPAGLKPCATYPESPTDPPET
jgi:hypothetical protein